MIIKSIRIKEGLFVRAEQLSSKVTLIHSKDNTCGKTTLIRLILYSLGFNIPSTRKIRFDLCDVSCIVETDTGDVLTFNRPNLNLLTVEFNENKDSYILPSQQKEIHAKLFNTENEDILNNILGCIYADQEKGWTLLNRGTAIGSVHFNIEELLRGLTGRDCKNLLAEQEKTKRELSRYQQIRSIGQYQQAISESEGAIIHDTYSDLSDAEIESLLIQQKQLKKELSRIDASIRDNNFFRKYIADMKLQIRLPDDSVILVTEENFVGLSDTQQFLIAKRNILANDLARLQGKIDRQKHEAEQESEQLSFITSESLADSFDKRLATVPIDSIAINKIIRKLEAHLAEVKKDITEKTKKGNTAADAMFNTMLGYAKELGIGDESSINSNYLFTSNLKELSGAALHKTVFAFRLAYLVEVQKAIGIKLPIILDSPRGKEVDDKNIEMMMNILKRDFPDNQIIIASIFDYEFDDIVRIEIHDKLIDKIME